MPAKKTHKYYRSPRTTQEKRESQDKFDNLVRAKRRNLPNSWDDIGKCVQKSWKERRKTKYREKSNYKWYTYKYKEKGRSIDWSKYIISQNIIAQLDALDLLYWNTRTGIRWYGPPLHLTPKERKKNAR